jgi:cobalamin biosynthesis protein CbiG
MSPSFSYAGTGCEKVGRSPSVAIQRTKVYNKTGKKLKVNPDRDKENPNRYANISNQCVQECKALRYQSTEHDNKALQVRCRQGVKDETRHRKETRRWVMES